MRLIRTYNGVILEDVQVTIRQPRADSHCRFLHTYQMKIELIEGDYPLDIVETDFNYPILALQHNDYEGQKWSNHVVNKILLVYAASCEGLAKYFCDLYKAKRVTLWERPSNYAGYNAEKNEYFSGKVYGQDAGLTVTWLDSTTGLLVGGCLTVDFKFSGKDLDVRNWLVDFGSLKSLKGVLESTFDHKFLIGPNQIHLHDYTIDRTDWHEQPSLFSIEKMLYDYVDLIYLKDSGYAPRVQIEKVTCNLK